MGKLQVVTKENGCAIKLIGENGKVFAVAPVRRDGPPAAEKVTDSSRYFTLRIENDKGPYAPLLAARLLTRPTCAAAADQNVDSYSSAPTEHFSCRRPRIHWGWVQSALRWWEEHTMILCATFLLR